MKHVHQFLNTWLSTPKWWFANGNEVIDNEVTALYANLLDIPFYPLSTFDMIALAVLYDQVPRHVYRREHASHIIAYFHTKSLGFLNTKDPSWYEDIHDSLLCFALLPLRHSKDVYHVMFALKIVWAKIRVAKACGEVKRVDTYKRFLKATYERITKQCDTAPFLVSFHETRGDGEGQKDVTFSRFASILDWSGCQSDGYGGEGCDEVIFERPFDTLGSGLLQRCLHEHQGVLVSLSGGVDSMVCSYYAKYVLGKKGIHVACVHINYMNRETSCEEEAYVKTWCEHMRLPLFVRRINEIHRPLCMEIDMRETYETYTKHIRYETYKYAAHVFFNMHTPHVILGHNKDDCFENIMTNIVTCSKYDNLLGMQTWCEQDNIVFHRPLLQVSKKFIVKRAIDLCIPYLYDSTPAWSQRGKIRDVVVPAIHTWNPRFVDSSFRLSAHLSDMSMIAAKYIDTMIRDGVFEDGKDVRTFRFKMERDIMCIASLWHGLFQRLAALYTFDIPSQKSIGMFMGRLQRMEDGACMVIRADLTKHMKVLVKGTQVEIMCLYL